MPFSIKEGNKKLFSIFLLSNYNILPMLHSQWLKMFNEKKIDSSANMSKYKIYNIFLLSKSYKSNLQLITCKKNYILKSNKAN